MLPYPTARVTEIYKSCTAIKELFENLKNMQTLHSAATKHAKFYGVGEICTSFIVVENCSLEVEF